MGAVDRSETLCIGRQPGGEVASPGLDALLLDGTHYFDHADTGELLPVAFRLNPHDIFGRPTLGHRGTTVAGIDQFVVVDMLRQIGELFDAFEVFPHLLVVVGLVILEREHVFGISIDYLPCEYP